VDVDAGINSDGEANPPDHSSFVYGDHGEEPTLHCNPLYCSFCQKDLFNMQEVLSLITCTNCEEQLLHHLCVSAYSAWIGKRYPHLGNKKMPDRSHEPPNDRICRDCLVSEYTTNEGGYERTFDCQYILVCRDHQYEPFVAPPSAPAVSQLKKKKATKAKATGKSKTAMAIATKKTKTKKVVRNVDYYNDADGYVEEHEEEDGASDDEEEGDEEEGDERHSSEEGAALGEKRRRKPKTYFGF
jgi:hypothetical protein